ncbi:MAG: type II toxin-antitoxin system HicA family toxin [Verrucomicrobiia bacterium]
MAQFSPFGLKHEHKTADDFGRRGETRLGATGFFFARQKGSHAILRKETAEGTRGCVVPMHREINRGTLRGVLEQAGVTAEEFIANL